MKLKKLLKAIPLEIYRGGKEIDITGVTSHSKLVCPGNLFIARKGLVHDGAKYVDEAIQSGAVAILSEVGNPFLPKHIVQLVHPDLRKIEAKIAALYYGFPAKELKMIGVTGTNGKTTVTYLLKYLLDSVNILSGLIGTVECIFGTTHRPSERTTPDCSSIQKMLREMCKANCKTALLEVTSHALDQGRVNEIDFDVAVFTNLTHDHLDYHKTMENYAAAKATLFTNLGSQKHAVINSESPYAKQMVAHSKAHIMTFGFSNEASLYADQIQLFPDKSLFNVNFEGKSVPFYTKLSGRHNILNCLAAIGACLCLKIPLSNLSKLIADFPGVPGRLERVGNEPIFVDYAHSPDALQNVLKTLSEIKGKGRLITVFGCGGNRDKEKRPVMAKVSETFSDMTIVTSDNPRNENPETIIKEIEGGFTSNKYMIEVDRMRAIEKALKMRKKEDLILIAGKGHETQQIFAHHAIAFDDRRVTEKILGLEQKR